MTNPLMQYLDPIQPAPQTLSGATKYQDPRIAASFDAKRETDPKRVIAKNVIKTMLSDLPPKTRILDAGCGTGLMFEFFVEKQFTVCGIDLSEAMLLEAGKKLDAYKAQGLLHADFTLGVGSVYQLPLEDKCVEAAIMVDLTRWIIEERGPQGIVDALKELQRVAKQRIILTARVANHKWAVTEDLIKSGLDGWVIVASQAGSDLDYRIICAEPVA